MNKILISLIVLLCIVLNASAQVTLTWSDRENGTDNVADYGTFVQADALGNVYVVGYKNSAVNHQTEIYLAKYSPAGVKFFEKRFTEPSINDEAIGLRVDAAGNIYIVGTRFSIFGTNDYLVIKYDSQGNFLWDKNYGTELGDDGASDMAIDLTPPGDATGANIYVTGSSQTTGINYDIVTIKYNTDGSQLWTAVFNGPANSFDLAGSIALDSSGNVFAAGSTQTASSGKDYVLIKYNSSGQQQWVARYNGPGNDFDQPFSIAADDLGNVYVTGGSSSGSTYATEDYATIKYNSAGQQQWVQRYNGPANDYDAAVKVLVYAAGNVYVTGQSTGIGTGYDYCTIKYSPSGQQLWLIRYNGPANAEDYPNSMALSTDGKVCLTGSSKGNGSDYDIFTMEYSQLIGIQPVSNEIPDKFSLSQNYPNPFNPVTHFGFRIASFGLVQLKVYDITGREISVVVNEELHPGIYEVSFDASALPSGVYFYRLTVNNYAETKKLILIK